MNEKFLTTEQVANILQIHPFTVLKFIKQGKIKGAKIGRVYRIFESDISRFIEERTIRPKKIEKFEGMETFPETQNKEHFSLQQEKGEDNSNYFII